PQRGRGRNTKGTKNHKRHKEIGVSHFCAFCDFLCLLCYVPVPVPNPTPFPHFLHAMLKSVIDIHSHILPEIDDGARSLSEAVEMAGIAAEDGIEFMVATPHMFNGLSPNPEPTEVFDRVGMLNAAITNGLKILTGNEVHVSHEIAEQVRDNRVTKINAGNYMLVEFPQLTIPVGAEELFYKLLLQGVRPILVHPERNAQVQISPGVIARFIERGVYIQVTAMSVTGEFGPAAKTTAATLLRHNCVHFLATDTHRTRSRPPIL